MINLRTMPAFILFISILCYFLSCSNNAEKQSAISEKKDSCRACREKFKLLKPTFYFDTTSTEKNGLKLEIISLCLLDSLNYENEKSFYINPVCISQSIVLIKNGKVLLKREHKSSKDKVTTLGGATVNVLEHVIHSINLRKGHNNKWFFCIQGWGGCGWCTSSMEIIDENGKTLYYLLENKTRIFKETGNFEEVIQQNGISKILLPEEKELEKSIDSLFLYELMASPQLK